MKFYTDIFNNIISLENLFLAWEEFRVDKKNKKDVLEFEWNLEKNIIELYRDLKYHKYKHGVYTSFTISDPKLRQIHKATVRDRVLHHALFRIINPLFEPSFISHSFSCRVGKGTHKGVGALQKMLRKVSCNDSRICFALKCDIKKFFDSVDHEILLRIIDKRINDKNAIWLIREVVDSFSIGNTKPNRERERERESKNDPRQESLFGCRGLPIGNLTSQVFANIYLNEFDYFIKHSLRIKNYVRYTDDFVIVSGDVNFLNNLIPKIERHLAINLKLKLHPSKVFIRKYSRGVDFLGYVVLPHYKRLRTKTKRRIYVKLKKKIDEYKNGLICENSLTQSINSYLGVISHTSEFDLKDDLVNQCWFWLNE